MEISKQVEGTSAVIKLAGQLDLSASNEVKKYFDAHLVGVKDLTLDLSELTYVASAGLRVLFMTQKKMSKIGTMKLVNVRSEVLKVLEVTRFVDYFRIEN